MVQEVLSQSSSDPEVGRFLLQVDRQTKRYIATAEAAETAGDGGIKKDHPIVRVSVYDSVKPQTKSLSCRRVVSDVLASGRAFCIPSGATYQSRGTAETHRRPPR